MPDALAESGKVKIWIVFVVQIIVGHIGMSEDMHRDRMGKADGPANLSMGLQGAGMAAATKGERRRFADIFVLPLDLGVFFLDPQLGRLLLSSMGRPALRNSIRSKSNWNLSISIQDVFVGIPRRSWAFTLARKIARKKGFVM